jgi:hypothetical protein
MYSKKKNILYLTPKNILEYELFSGINQYSTNINTYFIIYFKQVKKIITAKIRGINPKIVKLIINKCFHSFNLR